MKPGIRSLTVLLTLLSVCAMSCGGKNIRPAMSAEEIMRLADSRIEFQEAAKLESGRYVVIEATDIELPPTSGSDQPADDRVYSFDIWIDPPNGEKPLAEMLGNELQVDVLGAPAKITPISYSEQGIGQEQATRPGNVVRIQVASQDLTQSITIVAWFRNEFAKYEAERRQALAVLRKNAEGKKKEEGKNKEELLDLLREMKKVDSLPNPWGEVRTVRVFNGDLHTQIYMLSNPEATDAFGKHFAKFFYVGRAYFRNRHADKKLVINTTSLRARSLFYRPPNDDLAKVFLADGQSKHAIKALRYLMEEPPGVVHKSNRTTTGLHLDDLRTCIELIGPIAIRDTKTLPESVANADLMRQAELMAHEKVGEVLPGATTRQREEALSVTRDAYLDWREVYLAAVKDLDRSMKGRVNEFFTEIEPATELTEQERAKYEGMRKRIAEEAYRKIQPRILNLAADSSPIRRPIPLLVSPSRKPFASSPSVYDQGVLASTGYLWEDYYRPMPFEAVLVSLLKKTETNPKNKVLKWLEAVGVAAASLVGVEAIESDLTRDSYWCAVAVTTGVFLPEARKLLLEDIEEYLTNLGSLALGSVITIAPNESRDGYVFFPKGPIFGYGVDEFSLDTASFIVNIDNVDVVVDGSLVEKDFSFSSGLQTPDSQIEDARNRGRAKRDERAQELAQMEERLRSYRLATLGDDVQARVDDGDPEGARRLLAEFEKIYGADLGGTVARLRANTQGVSADRVVLLEGTAGSNELDGTLVLDFDSRENAWTGTYRIRLSGELAGGASVQVIQRGLAPSDTLTPALTVYTLAGTQVWPPNNGQPAPMTEVRFVNRDATADDNVESWHTPLQVRVRVPNAEGAGEANLSIRHSAGSADPNFQGATRDLVLVLRDSPPNGSGGEDQ